jgi:diguanylate cyclase (GGDEF)-like protein
LGTRLSGCVGFDAVRTRVCRDEPYVIGLRLVAQVLASALDARSLSLRLRSLALHDALTGLPNRTLLADRFDQQVRQARRSMLLAVVDIDDFKQVNDRHGHATGDRVLRDAAQRLQSALGEGDTVARVGGDEFVVLASGTGLTPAMLGQRLLGASAAAFATADGCPLTVGLSIGIAQAGERGNDLDGLLAAADQAMYRARSSGKNRWTEAADGGSGAPGGAVQPG